MNITRRHSEPASIRLADAYRFFVPLVFMTELNMISKSVIHAFLARGVAPSASLAAFNTSFTFYYTLTSATEVSTLLSISYLKSRRSIVHLSGFMVLVLAIPVALAELVAFTSLGDWLYGSVFGASAEATAQAKQATFIFSLSIPILLLRSFCFSLLMLNRRTVFISFSTLVRLLSLGVSLLLWPLVLDGASVGAAALVTCMATEVTFSLGFAWRHFRALPAATDDDRPPFGELWSFSWPLALNQASELGVAFVINLFLGRLANPDLALAAFGVVHGLVGLLMSPMRNLAQTAQTLAGRAEDAGVLSTFAWQLSAIFSLVAIVLFHTPADAWVLATVMGLEPELAAYCAPAMDMAFAMAGFWAFAALYRGLLAKARTTRVLAVTGGMRIAAAALIAFATVPFPTLNGAVVGLAAWIAAYAVESMVLRGRLRRRQGRDVARNP